MRRVAISVAAFTALTAAHAMPLGVRTAVWGVAICNAKSEVARLLPDPVECDESQISEVLAGFSDPSIGGYVTNKTEYSEFREWAIGSGARSDALASSHMAWKSYAMDLPALVAIPQDGDLVIDDVSISADGKMEAIFSLEDAAIGSAALDARLKTVFGVDGAATPDFDAFSSDNVGLTLTPTGDGRVKATVTPPPDAGDTFFMRVKVK